MHPVNAGAGPTPMGTAASLAHWPSPGTPAAGGRPLEVNEPLVLHLLRHQSQNEQFGLGVAEGRREPKRLALLRRRESLPGGAGRRGSCCGRLLA